MLLIIQISTLLLLTFIIKVLTSSHNNEIQLIKKAYLPRFNLMLYKLKLKMSQLHSKKMRDTKAII